jgi:tRNA dimethylallyltransferase
MPDSDANNPVTPILTGPTGSGKSSIISRLLEIYPDLHVISADSRQIYKYLDIGTDKPPREELQKYNYHLLDFVTPGERFTAFDFVERAREIIGDLNRQKIPAIICGGTGLYIKSLVEGIVELPDGDFSIREGLEEALISKGPKFLYERLTEVDPDEAKKIHPNNIRRIIRALEIFYISGRPKSQVTSASSQAVHPNKYEIVCLMPPRDSLYERINARVDKMIKEGLLEELERICQMGLKDKVKAVNVIGYNEILRYFDGEISLEMAINLIKQNSRRFAKRQITWFRGMKNLKTITSGERAFEYLRAFFASTKIKT